MFAGADEYHRALYGRRGDAAGSSSSSPISRVWILRGIPICMMWRAVPGLVNAMPDLKAVFCFGAGVDRLLGQSRSAAADSHRPHGGAGPDARHDRIRAVADPAPSPPHLGAGGGAGRRPMGAALVSGELGAAGGHPGPRRAGCGRRARSCSISASRSAAGRGQRKDVAGIESFAGESELPAFLDGLDILICLLPLTPETTGILNAELFARLKTGASLINVGRGGHLVEADLIPALAAGQLAAASLDVFAQEPLPADHPFWAHPRIFMTPHNASDTDPGERPQRDRPPDRARPGRAAARTCG